MPTAKVLSAAPGTLKAEGGRIVSADGRSIGYGDLAQAAAKLTPRRSLCQAALGFERNVTTLRSSRVSGMAAIRSWYSEIGFGLP